MSRRFERTLEAALGIQFYIIFATYMYEVV